MKNILWMLLLLYAGVVNAAGIKNCNVGADPWFPGRQVDSNIEAEYILTKPLIVDSLNSKGKPSGLCILPIGEHIVVPLDFDTSARHQFATREDMTKLAWVKRCGNPIVSRFHFVVPQKAEVVSVAPPVTPKSLFAGVDTNFNKTKFVPNPKEVEVVEEAPRETRVVRYVIVAPRVHRYSSGYVRGAPTFIPDAQYVRSDYYTSPNIHYPEPAPFTPQPQQVIVPPTGHTGGQGGTIVPAGGYSGGNGSGSSIGLPGGHSGISPNEVYGREVKSPSCIF